MCSRHHAIVMCYQNIHLTSENHESFLTIVLQIDTHLHWSPHGKKGMYHCHNREKHNTLHCILRAKACNATMRLALCYMLATNTGSCYFEKATKCTNSVHTVLVLQKGFYIMTLQYMNTMMYDLVNNRTLLRCCIRTRCDSHTNQLCFEYDLKSAV